MKIFIFTHKEDPSIKKIVIDTSIEQAKLLNPTAAAYSNVEEVSLTYLHGHFISYDKG